MTTMVVLVGGQPLPNLLPINHFRPDAVLFVYTDTTAGVYERLRLTVQGKTQVLEQPVNAYHIPEITNKLENRLNEPDILGSDLVFNLTGGTKPMSLAAFQVAQSRRSPVLYLESEQMQTRVYRYSWDQAGRSEYGHDELLPPCTTIGEFLDVHFGPGAWTEQGPAPLEGGSFERALAQTLSPPNAIKPVDDLMLGVKAMAGQIDLDVVLQVGNQFGIIEAKAGENGRKLDGIKQLVSASRHLGTYTQLLYAISVEPTPAHDVLRDASRIKVIPLRNYRPNTEVLSTVDTDTLLTAIAEHMGYAGRTPD